MSDKLCKDCKYFQRTFMGTFLSPIRNEFAKCAHAKASYEYDDGVRYITGFGRLASKLRYCSTMRADFGDCKPQALLWESKRA